MRSDAAAAEREARRMVPEIAGVHRRGYGAAEIKGTRIVYKKKAHIVRYCMPYRIRFAISFKSGSRPSPNSGE